MEECTSRTISTATLEEECAWCSWRHEALVYWEDIWLIIRFKMDEELYKTKFLAGVEKV